MSNNRTKTEPAGKEGRYLTQRRKIMDENFEIKKQKNQNQNQALNCILPLIYTDILESVLWAGCLAALTEDVEVPQELKVMPCRYSRLNIPYYFSFYTRLYIFKICSTKTCMQFYLPWCSDSSGMQIIPALFLITLLHSLQRRLNLPLYLL